MANQIEQRAKTMKGQKEVLPALNCLIDLFSEEGTWCQGAFAKTTPTLKHVDVFSPQATCWCLAGGIIKCSAPSVINEVQKAVAAVIDDPYLHDAEIEVKIMNFNDFTCRSQKQVVDALKTAREIVAQHAYDEPTR